MLIAQEVSAPPTSLTGYVWADLALVGGLVLSVFLLVWFVKKR